MINFHQTEIYTISFAVSTYSISLVQLPGLLLSTLREVKKFLGLKKLWSIIYGLREQFPAQN